MTQTRCARPVDTAIRYRCIRMLDCITLARADRDGDPRSGSTRPTPRSAGGRHGPGRPRPTSPRLRAAVCAGHIGMWPLPITRRVSRKPDLPLMAVGHIVVWPVPPCAATTSSRPPASSGIGRFVAKGLAAPTVTVDGVVGASRGYGEGEADGQRPTQEAPARIRRGSVVLGPRHVDVDLVRGLHLGFSRAAPGR